MQNNNLETKIKQLENELKALKSAGNGEYLGTGTIGDISVQIYSVGGKIVLRLPR